MRMTSDIALAIVVQPLPFGPSSTPEPGLERTALHVFIMEHDQFSVISVKLPCLG